MAATSWWAQTDSVNPLDPAVLAAQGQLRYLVLVILTVSVVVQAGRLVLSRKAEPLITVATGLLRFVAISAQPSDSSFYRPGCGPVTTQPRHPR